MICTRTVRGVLTGIYRNETGRRLITHTFS